MPTVTPVNTTGTPYATASFTQSGVAGVVGILTGQGIVYSVTPFVSSGAAPLVAGTLEVFDTISGVNATAATPHFYYWSAGMVLSGTLPPASNGINSPFFSGLNIFGSGLTVATGVTVAYRVGI